MVDPEGARESSKANKSHVGKLQLALGLQTSRCETSTSY